ncbi:MAG: HAMP domain-containing histidine kinase [Lachnospiraceae bacterium]|nr:HAMP domain-containing histidine kinase [Lachnospiraceae bacterium]
MKNRKILRYFFRERIREYLHALIWIGIFGVLFVLYDISIKYIWYPTLLNFVFFTGYSIWDYRRYKKRYLQILCVKNYMECTLENLPDPVSGVEAIYQELLQEMLHRKNETIRNLKTQLEENIENVTLWTHQIKTPLTALQLVAGDLVEPQRGECYTRLFEIEQYQDMMLQYLRLEGGGNDYVFKAYTLSVIVNQSIKYFARIFIGKGIGVKIDIPEGLMVVTDEKWLVFVLKQIISNALKYTNHNGKICIFVEGEKTLVIQDTGIGIAPEDIPRLFDRGYTGYNGRKDKKASGLGLFLSKKILENLNHSIAIQSVLNQGTRVEISFGS